MPTNATHRDSAKADQRRHRSGLVEELELLCQDVDVQADSTLLLICSPMAWMHDSLVSYFCAS